VRVSASGGSNLKSGAFVNTDGSVAVVIINSATAAQDVGVALAGYLDVKAWYTDNTHNISAPRRAMISFLFKRTGNGTVV
jgi:hypothetical protein